MDEVPKVEGYIHWEAGLEKRTPEEILGILTNPKYTDPLLITPNGETPNNYHGSYKEGKITQSKHFGLLSSQTLAEEIAQERGWQLFREAQEVNWSQEVEKDFGWDKTHRELNQARVREFQFVDLSLAVQNCWRNFLENCQRYGTKKEKIDAWEVKLKDIQEDAKILDNVRILTGGRFTPELLGFFASVPREHQDYLRGIESILVKFDSIPYPDPNRKNVRMDICPKRAMDSVRMYEPPDMKLYLSPQEKRTIELCASEFADKISPRPKNPVQVKYNNYTNTFVITKDNLNNDNLNSPYRLSEILSEVKQVGEYTIRLLKQGWEQYQTSQKEIVRKKRQALNIETSA